MKISKALVAVAAPTMMIISGCSATANEETPPDFANATERDVALEKYTCQKMKEDDPGFVYSSAGNRAIKSASTSEEKQEITREQLTAIRMQLTPTCEDGEPGYFPWLVSGYKEQLGIKFDYQTAKDAGVV